MTPTEERAQALGLPRILWTDPAEFYRLVQVYNPDEDRIERHVEMDDGSDLLGQKRWSVLPTNFHAVGQGGTAHAAVHVQWFYLARTLLDALCPDIQPDAVREREQP